MLSADNLCKQFDPNQAGLIWTQTVKESDDISERIFSKKLILKKSRQQKSMQNFSVGKELMGFMRISDKTPTF